MPCNLLRDPNNGITLGLVANDRDKSVTNAIDLWQNRCGINAHYFCGVETNLELNAVFLLLPDHLLELVEFPELLLREI